jgi:hypothetical protein
MTTRMNIPSALVIAMTLSAATHSTCGLKR